MREDRERVGFFSQAAREKGGAQCTQEVTREAMVKEEVRGEV